MEKQFFIEHLTKKTDKLDGNNVIYMVFLLLAFCGFIILSNFVAFITASNKVDFLLNDMQQIATYFLPIDSEFSQEILLLDSVVKEYQKGENVLKTRKTELSQLREYLRDHKEYLLKLGFQEYQEMIDLLVDSYEYKEEIFTLLGENQPFNYLVLLENGNEKRPNGGFFGSFAFVTIDGGHITNLQVIDSYLPDYIAPKTRLILPARYQKVYATKELGFIAGNKFGFTDIDGKNLKILFEKIFNEEFVPEKVEQMFDQKNRDMLHGKYIKGIVFLNSALLSKFIPGFEEKMWEWQFTNASVDIIRGENKSNKKELYLKEVREYFDQNTQKIISTVLLHWGQIVKEHHIQLYFSNITSELHQFLQQRELNTVYQEKMIYSRDINRSHNKIDGFVTKHRQIVDEQGKSLSFTNEDFLDISHLSPGKYQLQMDYDLNVPERYRQFIKKLEGKYEIKLGEREKRILALVAADEKQSFRWKTKGSLLFPWNVEIQSIKGDVKEIQQGVSDTAKIVVYETEIAKNNGTSQIKVDFILNAP